MKEVEATARNRGAPRHLYVSFVAMSAAGERSEGWLVLTGREPRSAADVKMLCTAICQETGAVKAVPMNWKMLRGS